MFSLHCKVPMHLNILYSPWGHANAVILLWFSEISIRQYLLLIWSVGNIVAPFSESSPLYILRIAYKVPLIHLFVPNNKLKSHQFVFLSAEMIDSYHLDGGLLMTSVPTIFIDLCFVQLPRLGSDPTWWTVRWQLHHAIFHDAYLTFVASGHPT